ncbi:MAG: hypothetical protein KKE20_05825 [Nanoarchaeota archaeon]|nr:hypothetical protein [Nanoarchaeota archaeon]
MTELSRKSGNEKFTYKSKDQFNLFEFWQWSVSDLMSNATRGRLAEFIVAKALNIDKGIRNEWDAYDLSYKNIKIETKEDETKEHKCIVLLLTSWNDPYLKHKEYYADVMEITPVIAVGEAQKILMKEYQKGN